jgi:hypothetical protein
MREVFLVAGSSSRIAPRWRRACGLHVGQLSLIEDRRKGRTGRSASPCGRAIWDNPTCRPSDTRAPRTVQGPGCDGDRGIPGIATSGLVDPAMDVCLEKLGVCSPRSRRGRHRDRGGGPGLAFFQWPSMSVHFEDTSSEVWERALLVNLDGFRLPAHLPSSGRWVDWRRRNCKRSVDRRNLRGTSRSQPVRVRAGDLSPCPILGLGTRFHGNRGNCVARANRGPC